MKTFLMFLFALIVSAGLITGMYFEKIGQPEAAFVMTFVSVSLLVTVILYLLKGIRLW
jgi:hypothetical protein